MEKTMLKNKALQPKARRCFLVLAYFFITIAYTMFANEYGLSQIKFLGIGILLVMLFWDFAKEKGFDYRILFCGAAALYVCCVGLAQKLSLSEQVQSAVYVFVLGAMLLYSSSVIQSKTDILAIGIGIALGVVFASLSWRESWTWLEQEENRFRIYGGFVHPNTFGAIVMAMLICHTLYLVYGGYKNKKFCAYFAAIFAFSAVALFVSKSRSAMLGCVIFAGMLLYLYLYRLLRWKDKWFVPVLLGCAAAGVAAVVLLLTERAMATLLARLSSLRFVDASNAVALWLGVGLTRMPNIWLGGAEFALTTMLLKVGIVGSLFYVLLLVWMCLRSRNKPENKMYVALFVTFLMCCVTEAYLTNITNVFPMVLWVLLGALSGGSVLGEKSATK